MKNPLSNLSSQNRLIVYMVIAVIVTAIGYNVLSNHFRFRILSPSDGLTGDTLLTTEPIKEDSIQLSNKKVPLSTYESDYSAISWYADFKANKVAFDKNYNEQTIDIHGTIHQITNEHDCAQIVIKGSDEGVLDYIEFANCPEGKDRWSDEVAQTTVGQEVHIRGVYSGQLSSSYEMYLHKCHIVNDN